MTGRAVRSTEGGSIPVLQVVEKCKRGSWKGVGGDRDVVNPGPLLLETQGGHKRTDLDHHPISPEKRPVKHTEVAPTSRALGAAFSFGRGPSVQRERERERVMGEG